VENLSCKSEGWLQTALDRIDDVGYAVVEDVAPAAFVDEARDAMYEASQQVVKKVGTDRLDAAGEHGVVRIPMKFDPFFFRLLEQPELIAIVDETVSPTAVLHLQNGFALPSCPVDTPPSEFQDNFHMDFPRVQNGYLNSINLLFTISEFNARSGGTRVVPGTQQQENRPSDDHLAEHAVDVDCPPGSIIAFDSTVWHAAGANVSGEDRLGVNHQFTRSYFKQQIDYVRALGDDVIQALPPRTQQMLGWYTRVPTSLDEYYRSPDERLYRSGQG